MTIRQLQSLHQARHRQPRRQIEALKLLVNHGQAAPVEALQATVPAPTEATWDILVTVLAAVIHPSKL